jgi:hypothetical protein
MMHNLVIIIMTYAALGRSIDEQRLINQLLHTLASLSSRRKEGKGQTDGNWEQTRTTSELAGLETLQTP